MSEQSFMSNLSEADIFTDFGGRLRIMTSLIGSKGIDLIIGEFQPGESLPPHYHRRPTEEVYYVYKGQVTVTIGDKEVVAREGDALYVPPGVVHYPVNNFDEPCWIVFALSPPEGDLPVVVK